MSNISIKFIKIYEAILNSSAEQISLQTTAVYTREDNEKWTILTMHLRCPIYIGYFCKLRGHNLYNII